jgi:hypothetical protein
MLIQENASNPLFKELTPVKDLTPKGGNTQGSSTNWYGRLSAEKKEEHLKRLRIARQQKKIAAKNLSSSEEQEPLSEQGNKHIRQEHDRARRQNLTPEERHTLLTKRNANYKARRNTPGAESIAMKCPLALSANTAYLGTVTNESPAVQAATSPHASPSPCTRDYNTESDGNIVYFSNLLHFCHIFNNYLMAQSCSRRLPY